MLSESEVSEMMAEIAEASRRGLPIPEDLQTAIIQHEAIKRGILPYDTFTEYIAALNPSLLQYEHVPKLVDVTERLIAGVITRLLVLLPPRYFKSEIFSRLLPGYYLRRFPSRMVGLASYGADLAWELSEDARAYFQGSYGKLATATQAKKRWGTTSSGEMWASGTGGPMLGRGYHLGIVDDPIDPEKVRSPVFQKRFQKWWPDKFLSRQEPNASIVFVMQRLGVDDPVDFLLRREVGENTDRAPQCWHVVVLDEIKSDEPLGRWDGPRGLPNTCTVEPDWRTRGQILAPSRYDAEAVKARQRDAGPTTASAQRQQRPMMPHGDFWQKRWFRTYKQLPVNAYNGGKDWDTAFTKDEANSASAYVESYRGPGEKDKFPIYIHDCNWDWKEFPELIQWIRALGGPHFVEAKATGKSTVQTLDTYGIMADEVEVKGDKLARASSVQPAVSNGRIYVREEIYQQMLFGEGQGLLRVTAEVLITGGSGLDLNDAFVQAVTRHLGIYSQKKEVSWA